MEPQDPAADRILLAPLGQQSLNGARLAPISELFSSLTLPTATVPTASVPTATLPSESLPSEDVPREHIPSMAVSGMAPNWSVQSKIYVNFRTWRPLTKHVLFMTCSIDKYDGPESLWRRRAVFLAASKELHGPATSKALSRITDRMAKLARDEHNSRNNLVEDGTRSLTSERDEAASWRAFCDELTNRFCHRDELPLSRGYFSKDNYWKNLITHTWYPVRESPYPGHTVQSACLGLRRTSTQDYSKGREVRSDEGSNSMVVTESSDQPEER
jgi:hypothetical protein